MSPEKNSETTTTDEERGQRCRRLAHDLKNSLAVIGSGLEVLKMTTPPEKAGEFQDIYDMMDRERKTATKLVDEMREAAME